MIYTIDPDDTPYGAIIDFWGALIDTLRDPASTLAQEIAEPNATADVLESIQFRIKGAST